MKDELGGKIITQFLRLKAKTYSYLKDDVRENKKGKDVIKRKLKFENYNFFFEAIQLENEVNHLQKTKTYISNI